MPAPRNVLFITLDQWRGDCLSALGHPVVQTPTLDALAGHGVLFANHWANAAPCGPSRACLYTGTYQHRNRSLLNGTPLDARFTNVALLAREAGYDPVLFGYTDSSIDPRTVPPGDPRLFSYEGVLPGFRPLIEDPWEKGSPAWGRWLTAQGFDVPADPHELYEPMEGFAGADAHGSTWAPARFPAELSQTTFVRQAVVEWLERNGDTPFFVHASFIRPHPPRRNPIGYHDLYSADSVGRFVGAATAEEEGAIHPLGAFATAVPGVGAPRGRAGAPPGAGDLLRRAARSGRRAGSALRLPPAERPGVVHPGRPHERPRRDGRRSLVAREARLLGRELPRPADRGGPAGRGRPRAGHRRRCGDGIGRRAADDL